jgi:hypothetical protein
MRCNRRPLRSSRIRCPQRPIRLLSRISRRRLSRMRCNLHPLPLSRVRFPPHLALQLSHIRHRPNYRLRRRAPRRALCSREPIFQTDEAATSGHFRNIRSYAQSLGRGVAPPRPKNDNRLFEIRIMREVPERNKLALGEGNVRSARNVRFQPSCCQIAACEGRR